MIQFFAIMFGSLIFYRIAIEFVPMTKKPPRSQCISTKEEALDYINAAKRRSTKK